VIWVSRTYLLSSLVKSFHSSPPPYDLSAASKARPVPSKASLPISSQSQQGSDLKWHELIGLTKESEGIDSTSERDGWPRRREQGDRRRTGSIVLRELAFACMPGRKLSRFGRHGGGSGDA
jgi:hypothetical protein